LREKYAARSHPAAAAVMIGGAQAPRTTLTPIHTGATSQIARKRNQTKKTPRNAPISLTPLEGGMTNVRSWPKM
jgi:hypothetical protein